jgi:hypothetical protein
MEREALNQSSDFPDEPFACPHCGQMLAPSVRVCASCKQPIDPSEISRPAVPILIPVAEQVTPPPPEPARFSWSMFFIVLAGWIVLYALCMRFGGYKQTQFLLAGVVIASSVWVYYDARQNNIPKALRWSLGSLLLWIVVFPWYLARRKTPQASCPLIEGDARPLLLILVVFFLLSAVLMMVVKGPVHH